MCNCNVRFTHRLIECIYRYISDYLIWLRSYFNFLCIPAYITGAIVGGLIGHFATKGRQYGPTPAPQVDPNSPQTARNDQITQQIIEKTSAHEIKENLRLVTPPPPPPTM